MVVAICSLSTHSSTTSNLIIPASCLDILQKWRQERRSYAVASPTGPSDNTYMNDSPSLPSPSKSKIKSKQPSLLDRPPSTVCERIVVLNKRDLVPEWGIEVCLLLDFSRCDEQNIPMDDVADCLRSRSPVRCKIDFGTSVLCSHLGTDPET